MAPSIFLSPEQAEALSHGLPAPIARLRTGLARDEILSLIVESRENGGLPENVKPDKNWGRNRAVGWYLKDDFLIG